jgi:hypothetical protein
VSLLLPNVCVLELLLAADALHAVVALDFLVAPQVHTHNILLAFCQIFKLKRF